MKTIASFKKFFDPDSAIADALDKDLADIATMTETEIKNRTPVVTGELKANVVAIKNGKLDYEVAANKEYAVYVEYGTSRFAPRAMMRRGASAVQAFGVAILSNTLNLKK